MTVMFYLIIILVPSKTVNFFPFFKWFYLERTFPPVSHAEIFIKSHCLVKFVKISLRAFMILRRSALPKCNRRLRRLGFFIFIRFGEQVRLAPENKKPALRAGAVVARRGLP